MQRIVLRFKDAQVLKLKNGEVEEDSSQVSEDKEEELVVETSEDESEEELVVPVKKEEEEDKCPQAISLYIYCDPILLFTYLFLLQQCLSM